MDHRPLPVADKGIYARALFEHVGKILRRHHRHGRVVNLLGPYDIARHPGGEHGFSASFTVAG